MTELSGKRVLVTGASDGIGLEIAKAAAVDGAELILPVRNRLKGEAAAAAIRAVAPAVRISLGTLDLASLDSVAAYSSELLGLAEPIDVLIANAGLMHPPARQTTREGFELQLGTNHLGHFALIGRLLPLLRSSGARVVTQTSIAARSGSVPWDDLQGERSYDAGRSYRLSKIAIGLLGVELQRRSDSSGWGISGTVSHPGVAPTNLLAARLELGRGRDTAGVRLIRALSRRGILFGTPQSAARPALLAATDPAPQPGTMYGPSGPSGLGGPPTRRPLYPTLTSAADAGRIWEVSEALTGVRVP